MDRMTTPVCRRKSQLSIHIAQMIHLNHHDFVDQRQLYGMADNLQRQLLLHMLLKLLCFNWTLQSGLAGLCSTIGIMRCSSKVRVECAADGRQTPRHA